MNVPQEITAIYAAVLTFHRRNFAAMRKGKWKLVVGQDDTYKIGWHERYPNRGSGAPPAPQTLPGAVIKCGTFDESKMCNSKNGGACLFDMSVGEALKCAMNLSVGSSPRGRGVIRKLDRTDIRTAQRLRVNERRRGRGGESKMILP